MRLIKPILVNNYNFGNLKIGHFCPNMAIWFTDYNGKGITDKKCGLRGSKGDTYTEGVDWDRLKKGFAGNNTYKQEKYNYD